MGRARALGRVPLLLVILAVPVLNAHRPQTADDVHLNFKTILIRCFLKYCLVLLYLLLYLLFCCTFGYRGNGHTGPNREFIN